MQGRREPRRKKQRSHIYIFVLMLIASAAIMTAAAIISRPLPARDTTSIINAHLPDTTSVAVSLTPDEESDLDDVDFDQESETINVQPSKFMSFSFSLPENEEQYVSFQAARPDLDAETVVWMVNAHLHLPFFGQIIVNMAKNPLLVNSFYRLPDGFTPAGLVPVNDENDNLRATSETVQAFRQMREGARAAGISLSATSAYRSAARQAELYRNGGSVDGAIMRPYHSEHQTGRAIDLWGPAGLLDSDGPTASGAWVANNAHIYGFILRYRADTTHITGIMYEPWHITYVGTEISMYMHENGILSLEEFVGRNPGRQ